MLTSLALFQAWFLPRLKLCAIFLPWCWPAGQPHTLQIVPRDEYDNPTNNSTSLRDEHNYSLCPFMRWAGSHLGHLSQGPLLPGHYASLLRLRLGLQKVLCKFLCKQENYVCGWWWLRFPPVAWSSGRGEHQCSFEKSVTSNRGRDSARYSCGSPCILEAASMPASHTV